MHSFIKLYIDILRPASDSNVLFLNAYGRPLANGDASRGLTKYFKQFGLKLSGCTTIRKVLIETYQGAFAEGTISQTGK
jgi:hypothetical protein